MEIEDMQLSGSNTKSSSPDLLTAGGDGSGPAAAVRSQPDPRTPGRGWASRLFQSALDIVIDPAQPTLLKTRERDAPLGKTLLEVLDRIGYGGLVLDTAGQVLQINNTGPRLLKENSSRGHHEDGLDWGRRALKALLRSEGSSRFRMGEDACVAIPRDADQRRPLILRAVSISEQATSGPQTVVILADLDETPRPTAEA